MTDAKRTAAAKKSAAAQPPTKAAAAAAEVVDEPRNVTIAGIDLTIPAQMPFSVLRYSDADAGPRELIGIMRELLGEEQMQTVWDRGLTMEQGIAFATDLMAEYQVTPGESSASPAS